MLIFLFIFFFLIRLTNVSSILVLHHLYSVCGIVEPTIDLLLTYQGFIAQSVKQRTGIAVEWVRIPL